MRLTDKELKRFWKKVNKKDPNGCWLWTAYVDKNGYGRFKVGGRMQRAHRISWILENKCDIPEDKPYILHSCNNPKCLNPNHLRAGTQQENMDDRDNAGRQAHKLTEQQIIDIYLSTDKQRILVKKYGVAQPTISNIKLGKRYGWLTKDLKLKLLIGGQ